MVANKATRCHYYWCVSPVETRNYGWSEVVEAQTLCPKLCEKVSRVLN